MSALLVSRVCSNMKPVYNMKNVFFVPCYRRLSALKKIPVLKPKSITTRTYFLKFFTRPSDAEVKIRDKIPSHFHVIYKNGMGKYLLLARICSLGTVLSLCAGALYINSFAPPATSAKMIQWGNEQRKPQEEQLYILLTGLIVICVVLHILVNTMPIRIYNFAEKGQYIFIFYGVLPTSRRAVFCKLNEVRKVEGGSLLPWTENKFVIDKKCKVIMLEEYFRRPADYNILLGYQKPEF